jgi:hypothetical protein
MHLNEKLAAIAALKKTATIKIPGTDETLTFRQFSTTEMVELNEVFQTYKTDPTRRDALVVCRASDELTDDNLEAVAAWDKDFLTECATAVFKLVGATEEDKKKSD